MARVITTILLDDNPRGLRLIRIENRSGIAFVVPRSKLKEFRGREEANHPGIYVLFGEGDGKPTAYVGQSLNIADRLATHDTERKEEEWKEAFVFVGGLDSTLIKYLESKTVYFAAEANRYQIFNGNVPRRSELAEAQNIIGAENFENIKLILSLLGYPLLENPVEETKDSELYLLKTTEAEATGKLLESQEFIVFKGSLARIRETASLSRSARNLRQRLVSEKLLAVSSKGHYIFIENYIFTSPSAAADAVKARSSNGWTSWKDSNGKTLDENIRT